MGTPLTATVSTVVFGGLALWYAGRGITGRDLPDQVSNLLHLLMATAMIAMPWAAGLPALPQVVAFSVGAFWYLGVALFRPTADAQLGVGHSAHGAPGLLYHAGMMLAMVWMAVGMIPAAPVAGGSGLGMDMGMHGGGHAAGVLTGQAPWALAVSIALGFAFALAALRLVVLLVQEAVGFARRLELADLTASTVMAAGMAYAFLVLAT